MRQAEDRAYRLGQLRNVMVSYPHFVGTIHAFVNQFFAMPMLRSLGQKIDVIDNVVFADRAKSRLQLGMFSGLRVYLENQNNDDGIATSLFYRTADLQVQVESGTLPGTHTASYKSLMTRKKKLTKDGIFRHRDMFAYADRALKTCPVSWMSVSARQSHLDRRTGRGRVSENALSGGLPAVRQQLADLAYALHGQACHHIAQVGIGVMPIHSR